MCDQRTYVNPPRRDQTQKLLHVAILGPAHVGEWIIATLLFVRSVVAARAVGTRHVELNFFQVHVVPRKLEAYRTHNANASAIAAERERVLRGRRRFRCRRDNRAIDTAPVGERAHGLDGAATCDAMIRTEPL